jgi:superfamily I DNA/RNA helicase
MQPTQQQLNCISAAKENDLLKIGAIAGSGKTSTLSMVAHELKQSSLYLAFNKVTALEAANKFPSHVTCRTTHSLAYAAFGSDLQHKLVRPQKYLNVAGTGGEIGKLLKLEAIDVGTEEKPHTITQAFLGLLVKRTVAAFEQSADDCIHFKHVPKQELKLRAEKHPKLDVQKTCGIVLKAAKKLWEKRIDPDSHVLATHDTYLKLYQLSKPILPYKVLYLDEAQDTTDCVLDIVKNQFGKMKVVLVGDSRQAIYGWRGAINAMDKIECTSLPLSKSFRYGQAVADIAMSVLDWKIDIVGNESITSTVGTNCLNTSEPYARLFRTNTELLTCAVSAIQNGKSVSIEIDVKDFVRLLQSAQALFEGDLKSVKHEKIVPYAEWAAIVEDADHDQELKRLVAAVMSGQAPVWISVLEGHEEPYNPQVIFTTAHKSKGREFKQVKLEDDFPSNYGKGGKWIGLDTEEQNLLYVACTRAINCLQYNQTVMEILEREKTLRAA